MPNPVLITGGLSLVSGSMQARAQRTASGEAGAAQTEAARLGIDETRRQFDLTRSLLQPYSDAGAPAIAGQLDLLGLRGPAGQQAAIDAVKGGPEFAEMVRQGEEALLANAAATGGLRGGDAARGLASMRPGILNQLLGQRFSQLGGLAGMGQASAAGVGAAGQQAAGQIAGLYGQQGAAQAGDALARGQATVDMWGNAAGTVGNIMGGVKPPEGATMWGRWGF